MALSKWPSIATLYARRDLFAEYEKALGQIEELEGLCKEWATWAMGFQHLGAIGRDILERTDKALRGEGGDGN